MLDPQCALDVSLYPVLIFRGRILERSILFRDLDVFAGEKIIIHTRSTRPDHCIWMPDHLRKVQEGMDRAPDSISCFGALDKCSGSVTLAQAELGAAIDFPALVSPLLAARRQLISQTAEWEHDYHPSSILEPCTELRNLSLPKKALTLVVPVTKITEPGDVWRQRLT
jgi:hypothetical protein